MGKARDDRAGIAEDWTVTRRSCPSAEGPFSNWRNLNSWRGLAVDLSLYLFSLVQLVQPLRETRCANIVDSSLKLIESSWLLEAQSMDNWKGPYLGEVVPGRMKQVALLRLLFCYVLVNRG